jgi:hypothetical protein
MANSDDSDREIAQRKAQLERRDADKAPSRQSDLIGAQPPAGGFKPVYLAIGAVVLAVVLCLALLLQSGRRPPPSPVVGPAPAPASAEPVIDASTAAAASSAAPSGDAADLSGLPAVAPQGVSHTPAAPTPAARPRRLKAGHDAYVCAHGDQSDIRTIEACDRKDAARARN